MADSDNPIVLPFGVDYADGVTQLPPNPVGTGGNAATVGTADPHGDLAQFDNGGNQLIQEDEGSPELERGEQSTCSHSQTMPSYTAWSYLASLARGSFVMDSAQNYWRMLSAKVTRLGKSHPGFSRMTTVAESLSFDTPPDDFSIEPVDLGVNITKNPRYYSALWPTTFNQQFGINDFNTIVGSGAQTATVAQVKMAVIRAIQTYQDAPYFPSSNTINGMVQNNIITSFISGIVPVQINGSTQSVTITSGSASGAAACALAIAAAGEIIQNLWYQSDTPYFPGIKITWTRRFFFSPWLNPGGYIEDPILVLPDYFSDPENNQQVIPNTGNAGSENPAGSAASTIFDEWAAINPQYFSSDGTNGGQVVYSALRICDAVRFVRTWFELDQSWMVSFIGQWNQQLFQQGPRPSNPSDYQPLQ